MMDPEPTQPSSLGERMSQACLLPEHDPVRIAVEKEIAAQGGNDSPAGREWAALLEEARQLRAALLNVPTSAALEARLLKVPEMRRLAWHERPVSDWATPRRLAIAATVIILAGLAWFAFSTLSARQETQHEDQLAVLAVNLHNQVATNLPPVRLDTADSKQAEQWLAAHGTYHDVLPGGEAKLTGAAVVQLGSTPAALTRWQLDGHAYSLLEFNPKAMGMAADFARKTFDSAILGAPGPKRAVAIWSNPAKGCGWVLVMDEGTPNPFPY
jgi:hypothetical protein